MENRSDRPTRKGKFPGLTKEQIREELRQYKPKEAEKRKKKEEESEEDTENTTDAEAGEEEKKNSLWRLTRRFKCSISLGKKEAKEKVDKAREDMPDESLSITSSAAEMALYRPIEYDDLMGTEVSARLQMVICLECYTNGSYEIKGRFKRTTDGEKPTFVKDDATPVANDFSVGVKGENKVGVFEPIKKNCHTKEMVDWLLNKHIVDPTNDCLPKDSGETVMRIRQAKVAISKFEKALSDEPDKRNQKYYSYKDGYMKFTTDMKARELKASLANAREIMKDERWMWTDIMKIDLLTKGMSDALRLKIRADTGKDPLNKTEWSYDDLEKAINKHAVVPVDPAVLARKMHESTRGDNIDETNRKFEDWYEAMEHGSKAQGN